MYLCETSGEHFQTLQATDCWCMSVSVTQPVSSDPPRESNTITIWNNGKGIPVVEHKEEKMYVPALIFGTLLTSSNYNDTEKKVTGENSLQT